VTRILPKTAHFLVPAHADMVMRVGMTASDILTPGLAGGGSAVGAEEGEECGAGQ
jgi:hypothetical protein